MMNYKNTVIFDIEASCDDKNINPNYNMETIEIGAVTVTRNEKTGELTKTDEFSVLIEPEYVSELTPFCTELTSITFDDLKGQPKFIETIRDFNDYKGNAKIMSCGDFDRKFLVKELEEKKVNISDEAIIFSINASHYDLKKMYTKITGNKKAGMVGMANKLNIELKGIHHRGIDDAKNLADIYIALEKIRAKKLKETFESKIENIVNAINKAHFPFYELVKNNNVYTSINKVRNTLNEYDLTSLLDNWKDVIIVDIEQRGLKYLSTSELETLKRYTV